jgi:hypothetical protein
LVLQWQRAVNRDQSKLNAFKAEAGSLLAIQAFLMIQEGSTFITLLHSPAKYFSITPATSRFFQGGYICFVRDRLPTHESSPVLIQATEKWEVKKMVNGDGMTIKQHYKQPLAYGKLWTPPTDGTEVKKLVPRLLTIGVATSDLSN